MCAQFHSFSTSPSPCLFIFFSLTPCTKKFNIRQLRCSDALPTACSVIASEPQWGLEPLRAALLTSGNLDVVLCVSLWLLQLQSNDAFDLLFVWKQREACGPAPLCPTCRTHTLKKLLFVRVCNICVCVCVHGFDSCSYVEDSSLKSTKITVVGSVSEGALQTSTALDKSKGGGEGCVCAAFTVHNIY